MVGRHSLKVDIVGSSPALATILKYALFYIIVVYETCGMVSYYYKDGAE